MKRSQPYLGNGHLAHLGVREDDQVPLQADSSTRLGCLAHWRLGPATLCLEEDGVGGGGVGGARGLLAAPHQLAGDGETGLVGAQSCWLVEDGHSDGLGRAEDAGAEGEREEGGLEDGSPLDEVLAGVADGHLATAALAQSGGAQGELLHAQNEAGNCPGNLGLLSCRISIITGEIRKYDWLTGVTIKNMLNDPKGILCKIQISILLLTGKK